MTDDFPIIDTPPWHRPATEDEIRRFMFMPGATAADRRALDLDGWTLSFFRTSHALRPLTRLGLCKGFFTIHGSLFGDDDYFLARLSHSPTGYCIANFYDVGTAAFAAGVIAHMLDWATLTGAEGKATSGLFMDTMMGGGLRIYSEEIDGERIPVWGLRIPEGRA